MKKAFGIDSMPETAENVAEQFNISRADQDAFALRSQQRAGCRPGRRALGQGNRRGGNPQRKGPARKWSTG